MQSISSSSNETTNRFHSDPNGVLHAVDECRRLLRIDSQKPSVQNPVVSTAPKPHGTARQKLIDVLRAQQVSDSDWEKIYWRLREVVEQLIIDVGENRLGIAHPWLRLLMDSLIKGLGWRERMRLTLKGDVAYIEAIEHELDRIEKAAKSTIDNDRNGERLRRNEIATLLGLHASTVTRHAANGKFGKEDANKTFSKAAVLAYKPTPTNRRDRKSARAKARANLKMFRANNDL
jgi:hypothetical protein